MVTPTGHEPIRQREVERVFDTMGWENAWLIEEWDGEDLRDLRRVLDDDQYQALLDMLQDLDFGDR